MGIRDSRHNLKTPRWGNTTGEVVSPHVTEPPGAKKDTGWVPTVDVPVGSWWNWLHHQAGLLLEYLELVLLRTFNLNHLMREGKGTAVATVTAGAGLSVNVTTSRAWIEGAMYQVPAAVNLALVGADPANPRNDLVVAQHTAGVPSYAIVTGTPAATPADPAIASHQEAVARVRVPALAVVPGTITDLRVFGALGLDHLEVDETFELGDLGGGNFLIEGNAGGNGLLKLMGGLLSFNFTTGKVTVEPEAVTFPAPIRRKIDKGPYEFAVTDPANMVVSYAGAFGDRYRVGFGNTVPAQFAYVQFCVPNGGEITAVRVYGDRNTTDAGVEIELRSFEKGGGAMTVLGTISNYALGAAGPFTLSLTGLSELVDQSKFYELQIKWESATNETTGIIGAELEYEETMPFDGI
jgi:hypothetical protein